MILAHPRAVILVGFFLVLLGVVLPVLMITHLIKTTFLLGLISAVSSMAGLVLGQIGGATIARDRQRKLNENR